MQRIGQVLHLSSNRNLIVKIESNTPRIGEIVVEENLTPIGKVFDIFGPVSSPYAAIKPTLREAEKLTGKTLYVFPSKGERRR